MIPACASTTTFATIEEFLDVADQCLELGYPAIKLHAWGDARADAELCQRLRDHVGPDVDLMYDGSAGFDLPDAIYLGRALSEANYRWYEEPIQEFSVTAYKWLSERVDVPLLVGETSTGATSTRGLHRLRLRHLRPHERQPPRRDDRGDAYRPSRRRIPAAGRAARPDGARRAPLHVHSQLHLLRVARDV